MNNQNTNSRGKRVPISLNNPVLTIDHSVQIESIVMQDVQTALSEDRAEDAIALFCSAEKTMPLNFEWRWTFITLLVSASKFLEAEVFLTRETVENREVSRNWALLSQVQKRLGKPEQAITSAKRAVELSPEIAQYHSSLGLLQMFVRQFDDAAVVLTTACELAPLSAEYWSDLGACFKEAGHPELALEPLERSLLLRSDFAPALINLASCLYDLKRHEESLELSRRAVLLSPEDRNAWYNMGLALTEIGRDSEAEQSFRQCIRIDPTWVDANINIGVSLSRQSMIRESLPHLVRAIELDPFHANAHLNLALNLLRMGDFSTGLREHEWRRAAEVESDPTSFDTQWDGTITPGIKLLLTCEQGLGDTIQFVRYAKFLSESGMGVTVAVQPALKSFLTRTLPEIQFIGRDVDGNFDREPIYDARAPLMSLPLILKQGLSSIPAEVPYIAALEDDTARWKSIIDSETLPSTSLKVGIVWAGNPTHRNDRNRSCALEHFRTLARIPGVQLFSLQKGPQESLLADPHSSDVVNLSGAINDFADTAAAIENLDLVISVDTSVAHLAGAMGKPTWVVLPQSSDWRWLVGRTDSPWYPTMKLIKQKAPVTWPVVFDTVTSMIRDRIAWKTHNGDLLMSSFNNALMNSNLSLADRVTAKMLAITANNVELMNEIGCAFWNVGQQEKALQILLEAFQIAPRDRSTVINCYDALLALGLLTDAAAVLRPYLAEYPADHQLSQCLAHIQSLAA